MAITFVDKGDLAIAGTAVTPTMPGSLVADDILTMVCRTDDQAISVANAAGGTWTEYTNSPVSDSGAPNRLTAFWSRYNGTQTAPTTSDSGVVNIARIFAHRGCITTGNPFDITVASQQAATTSGSITGGVTTVDACMIVAVTATDLDLSTFVNADAWANASLASITERIDQTSATGTGGGFMMADGIKTVAGTVDATTFTQANSAALCSLMIALKPPSAGLAATQTDPEGLLDSIAIVADFLRSQDDALGITDSVTYELIQSVTITDPLGMVDDGQWFEVAPDVLGLTDSVTSQIQSAGAATVTDPLGLTDSLTVDAAIVVTIADSLGLVDSVSSSTTGATFWTPNPVLYDPVTAGDTPPWN